MLIILAPSFIFFGSLSCSADPLVTYFHVRCVLLVHTIANVGETDLRYINYEVINNWKKAENAMCYDNQDLEQNLSPHVLSYWSKQSDCPVRFYDNQL